MSRTLVADLPPMTADDLTRFEREGGVWGKQRAIRREQLRVAAAAAAVSTAAGFAYVKVIRRNSWFVVVGTLPLFTLVGFVTGNTVGQVQFPSVAANKETTMMRRTWWAKQCSQNWDLSQIDRGYWKAAYPHLKVPQ